MMVFKKFGISIFLRVSPCLGSIFLFSEEYLETLIFWGWAIMAKWLLLWERWKSHWNFSSSYTSIYIYFKHTYMYIQLCIYYVYSINWETSTKWHLLGDYCWFLPASFNLPQSMHILLFHRGWLRVMESQIWGNTMATLKSPAKS